MPVSEARIIVGDCREVMAGMPEASVHAVVTDPPYELGFMGKAWDRRGVAFDPETWRAVLRVLRPGGHLLAFGGTRTYHRMACAIEDAGFEVRDCLAWMYGSGFPKSKNLDGAWDGWGTALKPAFEPIVMARKPLGERNVAANVERWGTGAVNVDGCRIEHASAEDLALSKSKNPGRSDVVTSDVYGANRPQQRVNDAGRWPANVVLDPDAAALLDEQSGELGFSGGTEVAGEAHPNGIYGSRQKEGRGQIGHGDAGGASRFYYVAKPDRAERDAGLSHLAAQTRNRVNPGGLEHDPKWAPVQAKNVHPTVKPVALMTWLVRLVTPPGGTVLDPFTGSGTTGMACAVESFDFVGIEQSAEYAGIAAARIKHAAPLFVTVTVEDRRAVEAITEATA